MKNWFSFLSCTTAALALSTAIVAPAAENPMPAPKQYFVYFGTYTKAASKGIYLARLDVATGKLSAPELAAECRDPSFLALHPNGQFLYAVEEGADGRREAGRGVSAYARDAVSGKLTLLNQQFCGGSGPCHITVDQTGKAVMVANYNSGSAISIRLQPDGRLGTIGSEIQHTGSSVNRSRQSGPHAHAATLSPDNRFVFVPDLGLDQVRVYRLDPNNATLAAHGPAFAALPPGSGPRHIAFHPNGKSAYVINEMLCTVAAFRYDAQLGELKELQNLSTLPAGETVKPGTSTAEIAVHPSGKFLYGSNRGHNSISVFTVDASTGQLAQVQNQSTLGRTPRHFGIDPTGTWLLAENQDTSNVAVFRIDARTGQLVHTGQLLEVPNPVCSVFAAAR
ncbi:MAG: lactonase family protein [Opitutaceae bacterium]